MTEGKKITLLDEGTGVLKTHIAKELIETIMQKQLNTQAKFGDNWTAKSIADGVGFISVVGLFEPKWTEDAEILPEKFIVKMPTCINAKKMSEGIDKEGTTQEEIDEMWNKWQSSIRTMHNAEVEFYEYFTEKAANYDELRLPKVFEDFQINNNMQIFDLLSEKI